MKTFILKAFTSIVASAFIFSSCLDDGDSSIQSSQDLAFITSQDYTVCAATSSGYITSPEIQNLRQNECYIIAYKISQSAVNGIYPADYVANISKDPLPQTNLQESIIPKELEDNIPVKKLTIPILVPTNYMGDRWLFYYSTSSKESEKVTAHFLYNKDNQIDKNDKDISKDNKVIIDVYFTKPDLKESSADTQEGISSAIGNLERLRNIYTADYTNAVTGQDGNKHVPVLIQFRYNKYVSAEKDPEVTFLGSWDTNSKVYYMAFTQKK